MDHFDNGSHALCGTNSLSILIRNLLNQREGALLDWEEVKREGESSVLWRLAGISLCEDIQSLTPFIVEGSSCSRVRRAAYGRLARVIRAQSQSMESSMVQRRDGSSSDNKRVWRWDTEDIAKQTIALLDKCGSAAATEVIKIVTVRSEVRLHHTMQLCLERKSKTGTFPGLMKNIRPLLIFSDPPPTDGIYTFQSSFPISTEEAMASALEVLKAECARVGFTNAVNHAMLNHTNLPLGVQLARLYLLVGEEGLSASVPASALLSTSRSSMDGPSVTGAGARAQRWQNSGIKAAVAVWCDMLTGGIDAPQEHVQMIFSLVTELFPYGALDEYASGGGWRRPWQSLVRLLQAMIGRDCGHIAALLFGPSGVVENGKFHKEITASLFGDIAVLSALAFVDVESCGLTETLQDGNVKPKGYNPENKTLGLSLLEHLFFCLYPDMNVISDIVTQSLAQTVDRHLSVSPAYELSENADVKGDKPAKSSKRSRSRGIGTIERKNIYARILNFISGIAYLCVEGLPLSIVRLVPFPRRANYARHMICLNTMLNASNDGDSTIMLGWKEGQQLVRQPGQSEDGEELRIWLANLAYDEVARYIYGEESAKFKFSLAGDADTRMAAWNILFDTLSRYMTREKAKSKLSPFLMFIEKRLRNEQWPVREVVLRRLCEMPSQWFGEENFKVVVELLVAASKQPDCPRVGILSSVSQSCYFFNSFVKNVCVQSFANTDDPPLSITDLSLKDCFRAHEVLEAQAKLNFLPPFQSSSHPRGKTMFFLSRTRYRVKAHWPNHNYQTNLVMFTRYMNWVTSKDNVIYQGKPEVQAIDMAKEFMRIVNGKGMRCVRRLNAKWKSFEAQLCESLRSLIANGILFTSYKAHFFGRQNEWNDIFDCYVFLCKKLNLLQDRGALELKNLVEWDNSLLTPKSIPCVLQHCLMYQPLLLEGDKSWLYASLGCKDELISASLKVDGRFYPRSEHDAYSHSGCNSASSFAFMERKTLALLQYLSKEFQQIIADIASDAIDLFLENISSSKFLSKATMWPVCVYANVFGYLVDVDSSRLIHKVQTYLQRMDGDDQKEALCVLIIREIISFPNCNRMRLLEWLLELATRGGSLGRVALPALSSISKELDPDAFDAFMNTVASIVSSEDKVVKVTVKKELYRLLSQAKKWEALLKDFKKTQDQDGGKNMHKDAFRALFEALLSLCSENEQILWTIGRAVDTTLDVIEQSAFDDHYYDEIKSFVLIDTFLASVGQMTDESGRNVHPLFPKLELKEATKHTLMDCVARCIRLPTPPFGSRKDVITNIRIQAILVFVHSSLVFYKSENKWSIKDESLAILTDKNVPTSIWVVALKMILFCCKTKPANGLEEANVTPKDLVRFLKEQIIPGVAEERSTVSECRDSIRKRDIPSLAERIKIMKPLFHWRMRAFFMLTVPLGKRNADFDRHIYPSIAGSAVFGERHVKLERYAVEFERGAKETTSTYQSIVDEVRAAIDELPTSTRDYIYSVFWTFVMPLHVAHLDFSTPSGWTKSDHHESTYYCLRNVCNLAQSEQSIRDVARFLPNLPTQYICSKEWDCGHDVQDPSWLWLLANSSSAFQRLLAVLLLPKFANNGNEYLWKLWVPLCADASECVQREAMQIEMSESSGALVRSRYLATDQFQ
eukprot:Nk52_evm2s241 gene=Nk52_evmTU2s241